MLSSELFVEAMIVVLEDFLHVQLLYQCPSKYKNLNIKAEHQNELPKRERLTSQV